jgi:predicted RNA binding protein YcfA (HicA-like mRNA interferase family)
MKPRKVNQIIERNGGLVIRQVGSHRRYRVQRDGRRADTVVPQHHGRDIPRGTLRAIEKDLESVLGEGWLR